MSQRKGLPGARGAGRGAAGSGGQGNGNNAGLRGALLLGVAVILGIVLLQQFDTDIDTGGQVAAATSIPPSEETTTTRRAALTSVPQVTPTTARIRAKGEVKVLVANGAGVRGLGAATTNALKNAGYTTLTPTDTTTSPIDKTAIQFAEGFEAEARDLAGLIGQPATVVARLSAPPVAAADLEGANVVVVLGVDVTATTTTAAGTGPTTSTTRRP